MQKCKSAVLALALVLGLATAPLAVSVVSESAHAQTAKEQICKGINNGSEKCSTSGDNDLGGWIRGIINVILYILGAIAVLMIVIGGLRYVLSGGEASQTKSAKDTILYAVIGLVVALLAYAIVNFVVFNLKTS